MVVLLKYELIYKINPYRSVEKSVKCLSVDQFIPMF